MTRHMSYSIFVHAACGRFSRGVEVCHVFPVLWMTSCFHALGHVMRRVYSKVMRA